MRLGRKIAIAVFAGMLATGIPAGVDDKSIARAEAVTDPCPPDSGSRRVVRIDRESLDARKFAINQAVNEAVVCRPAGQALTIQIAAGVYPYKNAIRLGSDVTLMGVGPATRLVVMRPADEEKGPDDDEGIGFPDKGGPYKNIVIKDLDLEGPGHEMAKEIDGIQLADIESGGKIERVRVRKFSRDGILLSPKGEGVNSTVITDCEASGNGRNGISITNGRDNVIQRCIVRMNSSVRTGIYGVAGISLEPDSLNRVYRTLVRWNTINDNKHNGIGLAQEDRKRGGNYENIICGNTLSGNGADPISELTGNIGRPNSFSGNEPSPDPRAINRRSNVSNIITNECLRELVSNR